MSSIIIVCLFFPDVNECQDNPCTHPNAKCINTDGSFYCMCVDGYTGNGTVCSAGNDNCFVTCAISIG